MYLLPKVTLVIYHLNVMKSVMSILLRFADTLLHMLIDIGVEWRESIGGMNWTTSMIVNTYVSLF